PQAAAGGQPAPRAAGYPREVSGGSLAITVVAGGVQACCLQNRLEVGVVFLAPEHGVGEEVGQFQTAVMGKRFAAPLQSVLVRLSKAGDCCGFDDLPGDAKGAVEAFLDAEQNFPSLIVVEIGADALH